MNKLITAMVFTLNEERRIQAVYQNLKDFCEIIVFDGGSTDGTETFCQKAGVRLITRPADSSEMRLNTIKWAYKNVPTEYVLHVYAAHFYPEGLLREFAKAANEGRLDAVYNDVVIYRYGKVVHKPVIRRIASVCVFYRKSVVNFANSKIHDEYAITFNKSTMVRLPGCDDLSLHLFQDEDCESFTKKTINYEALEARQRFNSGERIRAPGIVLGPLVRFIFRYFRTGSFTKGAEGLVYSVLNLIYDINVSIILWELTNRLTLSNAIQKNAERRAQLIAKYKCDGGRSVL